MIAVGTVVSLLSPGASTVPTAQAAPAPVCYNPMDVNIPEEENPLTGAGFTVRTTGDASFANSEFEGTMAIGGRLAITAGDRYPVVHSIAGYGGYPVPLIDQARTRVLIQQFAAGGWTNSYGDTTTKSIVQVKPQGGTAGTGIAKISDPTTPGFVFRQGWDPGSAYAPSNGTNQSVQISSFDTQWVSPSGNPSMDALKNVNDYFPNNSGSWILKADSGVAWKTPTFVKPNDQLTVRIDPTGPNRVEYATFYSQLAGAMKFNLSQVNTDTPLIIHVSPTDVKNGVVYIPEYINTGASDPVGVGSVLFDLSDLSGTVEIRSLTNRTRGAFYAPNVDLRNTNAQIEGQIHARSFKNTVSGEELHTNLFLGKLCVTPKVGRFTIEKVVQNSGAADLAANQEFTFSYTVNGGQATTVRLKPGSTNRWTSDEIAAGSTVRITEITQPTLQGYTWSKVAFSGTGVQLGADGSAQLTIVGDQTLAVTATNTYIPVPRGTFALAKALVGVDASVFAPGATITVTATWQVDGASVTKQYALPVDGTWVQGETLPVGTKVHFEETGLVTPDNYTFVSTQFSAQDITITETTSDDQVTVTNTYQQDSSRIYIRKLGLNCDTDQAECVLQGAEFALYDVDPSRSGAQPITGGIQPTTLLTDGFVTTNLRYSTDYWLVETKAPAGHELLATPVKFQLTRDAQGAETLTIDPATAGLTATDLNGADQLLILEVKDVTPVHLPEAGGNGVLPFAVMGMLLMAAGIAFNLTDFGKRSA